MDSNAPACKRSPSANSTLIAEQFSLNIGPAFPSSTTSDNSPRKLWPTPQARMPGGGVDSPKVQNLLTGNRHSFYLTHAVTAEEHQPGIITGSTSSAEASPAKTSASPAKVLVLQAKGVGYGANTTDSFANFDPATSSWRTSQRCLVEGWQQFSETWPRSGMTRNGTAYRLPTLAPLTGVTESGLLPTPTAGDAKASGSRNTPTSQAHPVVSLCDAVRGDRGTGRQQFATPDANCWKGGAENQRKGQLNGSLNPTWVEWLMGFPLGWTALKHWATRLSRKSSK